MNKHADTYLSKDNEHLHIRVFLIPHHVIHKCRSRIPVTSDGHAFIDAVGGSWDDVVEFVRHSTWSRHVGNAVDSKKNISLQWSD